MFYCLTLLHKNPKLKWVLLLVINFFSVFTGFGLFLGLITPGLAIREVIHAFKLRDKSYAFIYVISFSISILTWVLFFVDYKFADTAPSGPTTLLGIFKFMALLLVHFYGASQSTYISLILGYGLLLLFLYITALHGYKLIKKDIMYSDLSLIIFCLCAYNLLYCFGTAYGRAGSTDLNAWSAPRYITLLIPGVLALILHVVGYLRSVLWSNVLCLTLCIGMFHFATYEQGGVEYFSRGRKAWRDAYLKTGDSFKANEISNFRVYPVDVLENKLRYLKDKKLNLFTSESK